MPRTAPGPNAIAIPGMNPGTFVAGGGGDGGAGAAGSKSGRGGRHGAAGEAGQEDAQGGGKDAESSEGACGAGEAGGCQAAHSSGSASAGDPVDIVTGRVFTPECRDLVLPGPLPLVIARFYTSTAFRRDVGLGFGWSHSLAWHIEERRRSYRITKGDGTVLTIGKPPLGGQRELREGMRLTRLAEGLIVRSSEGRSYLFAERDWFDGQYLLSAITDRNDNSIELHYDDRGQLLEVHDCVGRVVHVRRRADGHIAAFEVRLAGTNESASFFGYDYDEHGDLVQVTDAAGFAESFAYADHRMTMHRRRSGLTVHYRYGRGGRCIETWAEPPPGDVGMAEDVPTFLADGETAAKGYYHVKIDYVDEEYREVVNSLGVRRYFVTPHGKIEKVAWGAGVFSRVYDAFGRVLEYADANGATTSYEYDGLGRLQRETDPLGQVTSYEYDAAGRLWKTTLPSGKVVTRSYEERGLLAAVADESGLVIAYSYEERGLLIEAVLPNGGITRFEYDDLGNRTAITEPDGGRQEIQYDFLGRPVAVTDGSSRTTRFTYDVRGLLQTVEAPDGSKSRIDYDAEGRRARVIDLDGQAYEYSWGGIGLLADTRLPNGRSIRQRYNREGQVVSLTNEGGESHRFVRNSSGFVVDEYTLDGRRNHLGRDLHGRLVEHEGPGRSKAIRSYDAAGRLIALELPDGTTEEYGYDAAGRRVLARNADTESRWTYDARGNLVEEAVLVAGERHWVRSHHDALGRRVLVESDLGYRCRSERDIVGRARRLVLDDGAVLEFAHDSVGRRIAREVPGGVRIEYGYDLGGQLSTRRVLGPRLVEAEPEWVGTPAHLLSESRYDYSPAGVLRMEADDQNGIVENQHDAAGQLTGRFRGQVPLEEYRHDDVGNLYPRGQARSYGPGGRLEQVDRTTYVYDERARLIEKTTIGDDGDERRWTYSWNGKGLLRAVVTPAGARTEFVYDCLARRVSKRYFGGDGRLEKTTRFVWDGHHVVHEIVVTEPTGAREVHTHCFGDDEIEILASRVQGGGVAEGWRSFVTAPNGFPDLVFGADGAIVARGERDAWGRTTTEPAELGPFRYAGQYADTETGLYYNRHRYYDPSIGRYINADPIETARSLRLFAYVDNDPYRWIDPDGLAYAEVTNHGITGRGYSKTSRTSSAPIHPVVENNLAQGKLVGEEGAAMYPRGLNQNPLTCAEPAALSDYLYQYEKTSGLPPGSLQDEANADALAEALGGAKVRAYQNDEMNDEDSMEACPNCGVLLSNLQRSARVTMDFDAYDPARHQRRAGWDKGLAQYSTSSAAASVRPFERNGGARSRAHRGPQ